MKATDFLRRDHRAIEALFAECREATGQRKTAIIEQIRTDLRLHSTVEEEIFYPAVRAHVGRNLMNEADEEHHVARVLIAELDRDGRANDHRDAKFTVLSESVRHHIKDEEGEVLPKAKELKMDFEALGRRMLQRKASLKKDGVPSDAEHAMVAAAKGGGDTPAATARRRASSTVRNSRKEKKAPSRKTRARPSGR